MATSAPLHLALFEPDQPGNFGALLRLAACLAVPLEVVEPCGFPLDERRIRRAAMDYAQWIDYRRHGDLERFAVAMVVERRRLILLSAKAAVPYHRFAFEPGDVLVVGSESRGASAGLQALTAATVRIPMRPELRSLNVVTAAAIGLGEALRQLGALDRTWQSAEAGPDLAGC